MLRILLLAFGLIAFAMIGDAGEWFGFAEYPAARELCSQSVRGKGGEEILWHSYVTKDSLSRVAAFYLEENESRAKDGRGAVERHGEAFTLRRGNLVLTVDRSDAGSPQCDHKARAGEITTIVVSRITRP